MFNGERRKSIESKRKTRMRFNNDIWSLWLGKRPAGAPQKSIKFNLLFMKEKSLREERDSVILLLLILAQENSSPRPMLKLLILIGEGDWRARHDDGRSDFRKRLAYTIIGLLGDDGY